MGKLTGRKVVVTGAASGIGLATARLCKQEEAAVVLLDYDAARLALASRELGSPSAVVNITQPDEVAKAMAMAAEAMNGIDGLVHSAGVLRNAMIEDTSLQMWNDVIGVNLTGAFIVCQAVLPWLRRNDSASIVTVASASGIMPPGPSATAYGSSKAGLIGLTRAIAMEVGPKIRANVACPGPVDTPMVSGFPPVTAEVQERMLSNYVLRRRAASEEIAKSLVFLLSDDSSFMTGATIAIDGGRTFH